MAQGLSSLTLRRLLFALGALLVGVNLLSAIWDLRNNRAVVERNALRDFDNLTAILADQTARSLDAVRILLHQAATGIAADGVGDREVRAQRLRDRISGFPRIRALIVLDRDGRVIVSSDPETLLGADYSDHQYYQRQRDGRIEGAFVSEPFLGRIYHRWSFALSERLTGSRGEFSGVVAAIIDVDYVDRLFRTLDLGPSGYISLWNREGALVTRVPEREELFGNSRTPPAAVKAAIHGDGRYAGWVEAAPGRRVLASVVPVPDAPLLVAAGSSEDDVLAPWRDESSRVLVRTLLTSIAMLLLIWLAARELTRREAAERLADAEQERLQRRLRQSEKMEAIGRLAGGIAHDFNNVLGSIIGYGEMLQEETRDGSAEHGYAKKLLVGARRARDLVAQILAYSRTAKVARKPLDMGPVVREALDGIRGSLPQGIELRSEIAAVPTVTCANATQLHGLVMNLCTNAIHAMGSGGTLTVRLQPVTLASPTVVSHGSLEAGPYLELTVSDTGCGMDPASLARLFEPFFTTKEPGRGTGLGLAIVYGIVADSGGAISVATRKGEGSTFRIYLPRCDAAAVTGAPPAGQLESGRGERIMLVDDEIPLLDAMSQMLRRLGYEPEAFSDPRAAARAFEVRPDAYDLVLTDAAMPEMTGPVLARAVAAKRPGIPVLIVTGRAEDGLMEEATRAGVAEVVLKPLALAQLASLLARHLAPFRSKHEETATQRAS
jgi:signal transduction histidine kinase/CheY-like chemotaxis protein